MTARSIATATISFALVSIPVRVYSTTGEEASISFNMLHDKDSARLKQQYVCTACNEIVDREHTAKGYEHAKGQYVVFSTAELEALDAVATQQIAIEEFVPFFAVDPVYFEKSYYVAADKGSEKAFSLLVAALTQSGRQAVATWSTRGRQHLVVLRPFGTRLALHQLRYAHEVKPLSDLPVEEHVTASPEHLAIAMRLIEQQASDAFVPTKYTDQVHTRMVELIEAKVATGELVAQPAAAPATVIDLMDALRASLKAPMPEATPATTPIAAPRTRKARAVAAAKKRAPAAKKKAVRR